MDDNKALELRNAYLDAKQKYIQYVIPLYQLRLEKTLKTQQKTRLHPNYVIYAAEEPTTEASDAVKELFRKLSLKYHPDKLGGSLQLESQAFYQEIVSYYKSNDEEALTFIDQFNSLPRKGDSTKYSETSTCYLWGEAKTKAERDFIESMFITEEEYNQEINKEEEIRNELLAKREALRKGNDLLKQQIAKQQQNEELDMTFNMYLLTMICGTSGSRKVLQLKLLHKHNNIEFDDKLVLSIKEHLNQALCRKFQTSVEISNSFSITITSLSLTLDDETKPVDMILVGADKIVDRIEFGDRIICTNQV